VTAFRDDWKVSGFAFVFETARLSSEQRACRGPLGRVGSTKAHPLSVVTTTPPMRRAPCMTGEKRGAMIRTSIYRWMLFAAALRAVLLIAHPTHAQPLPPPLGPSVAQPRHVTVHGTVAQFTISPSGNVDGLVLSNDTVVSVSPRLGEELAHAVMHLDPVTVSGDAIAPDAILASSITNETNQQTIRDSTATQSLPPEPPESAPEQMSAHGTIKALTRSPSGQVDGVVLSDKTVVRFTTEVGSLYSSLLAPGRPFAATGVGTANSYGRCFEAMTVGASLTQLRTLPAAARPAILKLRPKR
jgi:hypothetical protein